MSPPPPRTYWVLPFLSDRVWKPFQKHLTNTPFIPASTFIDATANSHSALSLPSPCLECSHLSGFGARSHPSSQPCPPSSEGSLPPPLNARKIYCLNNSSGDELRSALWHLFYNRLVLLKYFGVSFPSVHRIIYSLSSQNSSYMLYILHSPQLTAVKCGHLLNHQLIWVDFHFIKTCTKSFPPFCFLFYLRVVGDWSGPWKALPAWVWSTNGTIQKKGTVVAPGLRHGP